MTQRQNGTVKYVNSEKGYGFITPESGPDLFVQLETSQGTVKGLKAGQKVTFVAVLVQQGIQAAEVQIAS